MGGKSNGIFHRDAVNGMKKLAFIFPQIQTLIWIISSSFKLHSKHRTVSKSQNIIN